MFGELTEASGSGFHPVSYIDKGGDRDKHDGWGMWIWAIIILVIFLFVIFLAFALIFKRGKEDGGIAEAITPLIAASAMNQGHKGHGDYDHKIWDVERDNMREFCNVRQEIKDAAWTQSRENDKYHYEQRAAIDKANYDALIGFKNAEVLGLQNTATIAARIDGLENRLNADITRKQGEEITYLKTVLALQPRPIQPSYPVYGPSPYPTPVHHPFGCDPACA